VTATSEWGCGAKRCVLAEVLPAPLFLARNATDRSRSQGFLMAPSLEKDAMGRRYPAPKTLHNFTRRTNGLNPAYRSLFRRENSFGPTAMDAFSDSFSCVDRRQSGNGARVTAEPSPRRMLVAQANEHGN